VSLALFLSLALLGFGPCWRIPGGRLSGEEVTQEVKDWSFSDAFPHCQVEVRPADPYSINANCYSAAGTLYLGCMNCSGKRWPSFVAADPQARVRFGDRIYPVRATRVTDAAELEAAWRARGRKYGAAGAAAPPADYWVFRLESRPRTPTP
jgi:hypothetical protein